MLAEDVVREIARVDGMLGRIPHSMRPPRHAVKKDRTTQDAPESTLRWATSAASSRSSFR